ncbi:MAG: ATPase, partial [Acidobacteria bacterium]|nr:ATPase [Acidobacteriota bacterium]
MAAPAFTTNSSPFIPAIPQDLADTGLPGAMVEQLLLKTLYFRGETLGRDLACQAGLKFSLIENLIDSFRRQKLVDVKSS